MLANIFQTWLNWSFNLTNKENQALNLKVFWSVTESCHSIFLKEARSNLWSQETLLTQKLFNIGEAHVKLIMSQPVVNSSWPDTETMSENLTHTVFFLIYEDVYGYCFYNDTTGVEGSKKLYDSQYSILQKLKKQYREKVVETGSADNVKELIYSSKDSDATEEDLIKIEEA